VQVFATEHFNEVVQAWTCAAAPVTDPDTGHVIGVIDLTGEMSTVHPHSMAVATATAQAVEAQLRCSMLDHDGHLLARYGDQLRSGPGPHALVAPSGRVIASQPLGWLPAERLGLPPGGGRLDGAGRDPLVAEALGAEEVFLVRAEETRVRSGGRTHAASEALSLTLLGRPRADAEQGGRRTQLRLRHSEIITLLCAQPEGLTSEELSLGIYGIPERSGSIRVEISRLRKLLGDSIETDRYRLRAGVMSDVGQVCGLLHRGEVREAAIRYAGPLLPESQAPGVVREREALESWMRQSVMSSGDQEALWSWVKSASGAHDLAAWQRLLSNLPFQDPRRSLAAARIGNLRSAALGTDVPPRAPGV
jgi:hypothetical protein